MLRPDRKPPSEVHVDDYAKWLASPDPKIRRRGIRKLIAVDEDLGGRKVDPTGGESMAGALEPVAADTGAHAWDRAPLGDLHAIQILREHIEHESDSTNRKLIKEYLAYREL